MGRINKDNIEEVMTYQKPGPEQIANFEQIRYACVVLVQTILKNAPDCADRTTAIRKVREARMDSNSAIALDGLI